MIVDCLAVCTHIHEVPDDEEEDESSQPSRDVPGGVVGSVGAAGGASGGGGATQGASGGGSAEGAALRGGGGGSSGAVEGGIASTGTAIDSVREMGRTNVLPQTEPASVVGQQPQGAGLLLEDEDRRHGHNLDVGQDGQILDVGQDGQILDVKQDGQMLSVSVTLNCDRSTTVAVIADTAVQAAVISDIDCLLPEAATQSETESSMINK